MSDLPFIQTVKPLASHAIELEGCAIIIWRWGVLNLMERAKVKFSCRVRTGGGGLDVNFLNIEGAYKLY